MKKGIVWMLAFLIVFSVFPSVRAESLPEELPVQSYGYSREEAHSIPPSLAAVPESDAPGTLEACDHIWIFDSVLNENVSSGTVTIRSKCALCEQTQDQTCTLATADAVTVNEESIYALDGWAEEYLDIPAGTPCALRLKVGSSTNATCRIISGDSVALTESGLIIPGKTIRYWYRSGSYMVGYSHPMPDLELVKVSCEANFGDSVVEIQSGSQRYQVTIHVEDYCDLYTNQMVDAYIAENFTDGMTIPQKMDAICRMPAGYDYSANYSSAAGMVVSGGGDCWASTSLILMICEKLGLEAIARNGNRDYGAGSGHMNALVIIGEGDYYELEAGYNQTAPRDYQVSHRTSLFCYRYAGDGLTIYQYDGITDADTTLVIPETIDGTNVVALEERALIYEDMGGLILPETLQTIGEQALAGCSNLTSIHIPASVTRIDTMAFADCGSLTDITCSPDNPAFCAQDGVIYNKDKTLLVSAPACGSVQLPETLERIGTYAFYYNPNVEKLILPDSVHTLEAAALANCARLKRVVFSGVESVEDFVFADNAGLSVFALGNAPVFTSDSFYRGDVNVCYNSSGTGWAAAADAAYDGTVTWSPMGDDTVIAEGDFDTLHWAITADRTLSITGSGAMMSFEGRDRMPWYSLRNLITSVRIQTGITSIGDFAFYGCSNLTDVAIPETVTSIGNYAFRNCVSLKQVSLPTGLTRLGESSFYACTSLESVEIPASLWTVQPYTFKNCVNLQSVTFHEGNLQKILTVHSTVRG